MRLFDDSPKFLCKGIIAVIIIGIAIRLSVGTLLTYNYDVYHWALTISNFEAGNGLYDTAGYYYTPAWGYILGVFTQFLNLFGVDMLGERIPEMLMAEYNVTFSPEWAFVTTLEFNFAITALITVFDLLTGYAIFWIAKKLFDVRKAKICAAVWFLCPFVIVVGAIGGMFDALSGCMVLITMALLMENKPFLAGMTLGAAFLLKFFPAFLTLLFIAYVVKKKPDYMKDLGKAALGVIIVAGIMLLPMLIQGNVMDAFSFLTARATTESESTGSLDALVMIGSYLLFIVLEIILAIMFIKKDHENLDVDFFKYIFIGSLVLFLYPATPQYILMVAPMLTIMAFCVDGRYKVPLCILMIGTCLFKLSSIDMELASLAVYSDVLSMDSWFSIYEFINTPVFGTDVSFIITTAGAAIQYLAILIAIAIVVKTYINKKKESC